MLDIVKKISGKSVGIFAAGVAFGTAGIKILSSKDAKKAYVHCTAAVLRAKECVMDTIAKIQDNASDVLAEAKQINEDRTVEDAELGEETETVETAQETEGAAEAAETEEE